MSKQKQSDETLSFDGVTAERVKIGILVDGPTIKGWEMSIIEQLLSDEGFELVAVIENCCKKLGFINRLRRRWYRIPWWIINRIEAQLSLLLFGGHWKTFDYAVDEHVPLERINKRFEHIRVLPQVSRSLLIHRFTKEDLERVRALNLDVLLYFGFNFLRGEILKVARFGVWSYHHADNAVNRGGPPGFWEVYKGQHYTGATLQMLTEDLGNGVVIRKGMYSTFLYSWNENRRRLYWKSRFLMTDALNELKETKSIPERRDHSSSEFELYCHPLFVAPLLPAVFFACVKLAWRITGKILTKLVLRKQWQPLLCRGALKGRSMRQFESVIGPNGRYWADPFLVQRDGVNWMFFEDFNFHQKKGCISCVRLKSEGYDRYQEVMKLPYHLSYPFLFEHQETLYMIPETHKNRTIELWKNRRFPDQWEKLHAIFDNVSAVDTTLLEHNGRWWMFVNIDRSGLGDFGSELFVYYTDDPVQGGWQPHSANPVLVDVRRARMGGGFTRTRRGRPIRCGQIGGPVYGAGLKFFEVVKLTTSTYEEKLVEEINPAWRPDAVGIHHCHRQSDLTAFDVCVRVPRFRWALPGNLASKRRTPPI